MTPDEHAAEAERILAAVYQQSTKAHGFFITADDITANLLRAQVHALLATRPVALEPLLSADPPPHTPTGYQRATTATGYAVWQHQMTDDGETCMQVKSSRYFPSNRLSASGECPPDYCACQGREIRTDPATWLPVYVPTTAPTTET